MQESSYLWVGQQEGHGAGEEYVRNIWVVFIPKARFEVNVGYC